MNRKPSSEAKSVLERRNKRMNIRGKARYRVKAVER